VSWVTTLAGPPVAPGPVHPAIAAALAAFDEAGVRWCLLRGAHELDRLGGDVDLLVHPDDLRAVRRVLVSERGFAAPRAWGRGSHRFFVDGPLKLDVVTELAFGRYQELRTGAAGAVLARTVRSGRLALPAPADAFWAALLHALVDRGRVRPERAAELQALARAASGEASPLIPACPAGWDADRIVDAAVAGRFDELLALTGAIRAGWPGAGRLVTGARVVRSRALRALDRRLPQTSGAITSYSASRSAG
jgi:hypothetical protein